MRFTREQVRAECRKAAEQAVRWERATYGRECVAMFGLGLMVGCFLGHSGYVAMLVGWLLKVLP